MAHAALVVELNRGRRQRCPRYRRAGARCRAAGARLSGPHSAVHSAPLGTAVISPGHMPDDAGRQNEFCAAECRGKAKTGVGEADVEHPWVHARKVSVSPVAVGSVVSARNPAVSRTVPSPSLQRSLTRVYVGFSSRRDSEGVAGQPKVTVQAGRRQQVAPRAFAGRTGGSQSGAAQVRPPVTSCRSRIPGVFTEFPVLAPLSALG